MSAALEEPVLLEVMVDEPVIGAEALAMQRAREEVLAANLEASMVAGEDLAAFFDLLAMADADYLDAAIYAPPASPQPLDWEAVGEALTHSQGILIGVQSLLSETLASMGVEDHTAIRVYADREGLLRLVAEHPRQTEIEAALNGPENLDLRTLYHAAVDGMSLAGSLVGAVAVPDEILERVKAKKRGAA